MIYERVSFVAEGTSLPWDAMPFRLTFSRGTVPDFNTITIPAAAVADWKPVIGKTLRMTVEGMGGNNPNGVARSTLELLVARVYKDTDVTYGAVTLQDARIALVRLTMPYDLNVRADAPDRIRSATPVYVGGGGPQSLASVIEQVSAFITSAGYPLKIRTDSLANNPLPDDLFVAGQPMHAVLQMLLDLTGNDCSYDPVKGELVIFDKAAKFELPSQVAWDGGITEIAKPAIVGGISRQFHFMYRRRVEYAATKRVGGSGTRPPTAYGLVQVYRFNELFVADTELQDVIDAAWLAIERDSGATIDARRKQILTPQDLETMIREHITDADRWLGTPFQHAAYDANNPAEAQAAAWSKTFTNALQRGYRRLWRLTLFGASIPITSDRFTDFGVLNALGEVVPFLLQPEERAPVMCQWARVMSNPHAWQAGVNVAVLSENSQQFAGDSRLAPFALQWARTPSDNVLELVSLRDDSTTWFRESVVENYVGQFSQQMGIQRKPSPFFVTGQATTQIQDAILAEDYTLDLRFVQINPSELHAEVVANPMGDSPNRTEVQAPDGLYAAFIDGIGNMLNAAEIREDALIQFEQIMRRTYTELRAEAAAFSVELFNAIKYPRGDVQSIGIVFGEPDIAIRTSISMGDYDRLDVSRQLRALRENRRQGL